MTVYNRLTNPVILTTTSDPTPVVNFEQSTNVFTLPKGTAFKAVGKATLSDGIYLMNSNSFGKADITGVPFETYGIIKSDLAPPATTTVPYKLDTSEAGTYYFRNDFTVMNLTNPKAPGKPFKKGDSIDIAGGFTWEETGLPYYLPKGAYQAGTDYAVPTIMLRPYKPQYSKPKYTLYGHVLLGVGRIVKLFTHKKAQMS